MGVVGRAGPCYAYDAGGRAGNVDHSRIEIVSDRMQ